MSFLHMLADLAVAAVEGIGAHQVQQAPAARRTVRRKEGCTPCAAMAEVDAARKQLGFSTGGASPKKK